MRKLYLTMLLAAGLTVTSAAAQQATPRSFPGVPQLEKNAAAPSLRTPSAIDDKSQGIKMYANQLADESKKRAWITFTPNTTYNFTRVKQYPSAEEGIQNYGVTCGTWAGDKYVAIFGQVNNAGTVYEFKNFDKIAVIDVATGDPRTIRELDDTVSLYTFHFDGEYGETQYPNFYDMAYDPYHEQLFALAQYQESASTNAESRLYTIDTETGEWNLVQSLGDIYYNFAFDYDGNMYATTPNASMDGTNLVKFDDNFQAVSTVAVTNWGNPVVMGSFGSLAFDYTSGDLWWICHANSSGYYYDQVGKLALDGTYNQMNSFGMGNQIIGLYIPYLTADDRGAAGQVTDLNVVQDPDGAMNTTLSWTNPTTTWDKQDLSSLAEVLVYRKKAGAPKAETSEDIYANSDLIATLSDVTTGGSSTFKDESPVSGINTYYVVPCRVSGEKGVPDSIRCYMGLDKPGKISYVDAQREGESIKLSWDAPENGANNGYVKSGDFTYNIVRLPDSVRVATGLTETSYTDNTLSEMQKYSYLVSAVNEIGEGEAAQSSEVLAGQAPSAPYTFTATSYDEANLWESPYNTNYENFYFDYYNNRMQLVNYNNMDNWLFAPGIRLKKGVTYRFTTRYQGTRPENKILLDFNIGTTATSEGRTTLDTLSYKAPGYESFSPIVTHEDMYTAPEDGTYYWGLHTTATTTYNVFYVYDLAVEAVLKKDLKAVSFESIKEAVAETSNNSTVTVRNSGTSAIAAGSYTVSVLQKVDGADQVVGTLTETPALESGKSAKLTVPFSPSGEGACDFAAVVSMEGDMEAANDTTAYVSVNVLPAGETAWTGIVTDEDTEWQSSYFPFSYADPSDGSESVYYADELDLPGKKSNTIMRIGYEYDSSISDAISPIDVKIYMANTDKTTFADGEWDDESTLTLVYDGTCSIIPGKGNLMSFTLDTPFEYDPEKNLEICVVRSGNVDGLFPAQWRVFNDGGFALRSSRYWSSSDYYAYADIATLYVGFADDSPTGIGTLKPVSRVKYSDGKLLLGDGVVKADIYDVAGKLVRSYDRSAVPSLPTGLYIIRTVDASGHSTSMKLNIQ